MLTGTLVIVRNMPIDHIRNVRTGMVESMLTWANSFVGVTHRGLCLYLRDWYAKSPISNTKVEAGQP